MDPANPIAASGIDVGKSLLDAHLPEGSFDRLFANDQCGRRAVLEATAR